MVRKRSNPDLDAKMPVKSSKEQESTQRVSLISFKIQPRIRNHLASTGFLQEVSVFCELNFYILVIDLSSSVKEVVAWRCTYSFDLVFYTSFFISRKLKVLACQIKTTQTSQIKEQSFLAGNSGIVTLLLAGREAWDLQMKVSYVEFFIYW